MKNSKKLLNENYGLTNVVYKVINNDTMKFETIGVCIDIPLERAKMEKKLKKQYSNIWKFDVFGKTYIN